MARDGSGNYVLPEAAFVAGTTIESTKMNNNLSDIGTALTNSIAKDGQTVPTAHLPMGGFKHTGVAVASARTDYARADQVIDGTLSYALDTGTATAYAIAPSPGITAYAVGQVFRFKSTNANSGSGPTLNVNSVGAGTIKWPDGGALAAGDIPDDAIVTVAVADISTPTAPVFHLQMPRITDRKGIYGLTYANNGTDATNDIDIAAGGCVDATGVYPMVLSALTKRLDAAWAVGTNQGGLDTGSIANTNYYIWAIARSDTGVTDVLFSASSTSPTMPTDYDYKRLIGWFKRASNAIVAFKVTEIAGGGIYYRWVTPAEDIATTIGTSRSTAAVRVPLHLSTLSHLRALASHATDTFGVVVCSPDETDAAPSVTDPPGTTLYASNSGDLFDAKEIWVQTSATGTISARSSTASTGYVVLTLGFEWSRR